MPDSSLWQVPAYIIAKDRAEFYKEDGYQEEYDFAMENDYILLDWAMGNMDWDDVKQFATKVEQPDKEVDFQEGWINGEKEIVDIEE